MSRKIAINPITRLKGHGKIELFLDENGKVKDAYGSKIYSMALVKNAHRC
ncbi:MAG: hypothetical protein JXA41_14290 [Deltaproteobacteria bacterium]|nr:hypothetical protein [Deltaproteobacteria bacterium]